jgi:hypothetical protein
MPEGLPIMRIARGDNPLATPRRDAITFIRGDEPLIPRDLPDSLWTTYQPKRAASESSRAGICMPVYSCNRAAT